MNRTDLYLLVIDAPEALAEALASRLFDAGLLGLEERTVKERRQLIIYSEQAEQTQSYATLVQDYLPALAEIFPEAADVRVYMERQSGSDWKTAWRKYFQPTAVTERIVVQPPWVTSVPPPPQKMLVLEPKMAFGLGTHASTRLAARCVERFCLAHPGCTLLDVGTGTGVLSLIGIMNGAAFATGIDQDPNAVAAAQENARTNKLADFCAFSETPLAQIDGAYDLVIANINAPTLMGLAPDLVRAAKPDGTLGLTGILADSGDTVSVAFAAHGRQVVAHDNEEEWILLELTQT